MNKDEIWRTMLRTFLMASAVSFSLFGDSTRVLPRYFSSKTVSEVLFSGASSSPLLLLLLALAVLVLALVVLQLPLEVLGSTDSQLLASPHSSHSSEKKNHDFFVTYIFL